MEGYIYILKSLKNNSYYIGSTIDIERRLFEHNTGKTKSIKYLIPWTIVFTKKYSTIKKARQIEYRLKKAKSRKIIDNIVKDQDIIMGP